MSGDWCQVEVVVIFRHRHLVVRRIDINPVVVRIGAVMSNQAFLVHASRAYHVMHPGRNPRARGGSV